MLKALKWFYSNFEEIAACIGIVTISFLMFFQVVARSLDYSILWSEELCRYLYVWIVALGGSYATKHSSHLRVDVLTFAFPRIEPIINLLIDLSILVVSVVMLQAAPTVLSSMIKYGQLSASMRLPMWIVYLSMPVSFGLNIVYILSKYFLLVWKKLKRTEEA